MFDFPGSRDGARLGTDDTPPKEVCVLPFPYEEVLLQGETKELRLYEDRFMKLFEDCMANHCGVVAMGLLADSGIIQTVPLCEVEAHNRMDELGIFLTIRVVGRASLVTLTQQEPYIKAVCTEITDKVPPNLDLPNIVAGNIENFMLTLSSMEYKLERAIEEDGLGGTLKDGLDAAGDDEDLRQRIIKAKLDDTFYDENGEEEEDFDDDIYDDDDDEDDDEDFDPDRTGKFTEAYTTALATDTQGYMIQQPQESHERSARELTAMSWAAFCTEENTEEDATFRIQALDCEDLFDRLKLASFMLREKKSLLKKRLGKAGIQFSAEDVDIGGEDEVS